MPIRMDDFHLFDEEHMTSLPLNQAYKAVELLSPEKSERFLYALRYATIVETRPTTHMDDIMKVVRAMGIDEAAFKEAYQNKAVKESLKSDLAFVQRMGIRSLPAYLLQYGEKGILINALIGYDDFVKAISELTEE